MTAYMAALPYRRRTGSEGVYDADRLMSRPDADLPHRCGRQLAELLQEARAPAALRGGELAGAAERVDDGDRLGEGGLRLRRLRHRADVVEGDREVGLPRRVAAV